MTPASFKVQRSKRQKAKEYHGVPSWDLAPIPGGGETRNQLFLFENGRLLSCIWTMPDPFEHNDNLRKNHTHNFPKHSQVQIFILFSCCFLRGDTAGIAFFVKQAKKKKKTLSKNKNKKTWDKMIVRDFFKNSRAKSGASRPLSHTVALCFPGKQSPDYPHSLLTTCSPPPVSQSAPLTTR